MSLNSAMQTGVSGLGANSAALATVSNNIANVNTVGYKQSETDFETLVTGTGVDAAGNSGGVLAVNRQLVDQQGQLTQTSSPLDLAISGQGFFVTTSQATNVTPTDPRLFTRAGSFTVNNQGYLVNSAGLVLQELARRRQWRRSYAQPVEPDQPTVDQHVSQGRRRRLADHLDRRQRQRRRLSAGGFGCRHRSQRRSTHRMRRLQPDQQQHGAVGGQQRHHGVQPDYSIQVPISRTFPKAANTMCSWTC